MKTMSQVCFCTVYLLLEEEEEEQPKEQPPTPTETLETDHSKLETFVRTLHEGKYIKPLSIRLEGMVSPYETLVTTNHVYVYFSKAARCDYEMGVCSSCSTTNQ